MKFSTMQSRRKHSSQSSSTGGYQTGPSGSDPAMSSMTDGSHNSPEGHTARTLDAALRAMQGTVGGMVGCLITRRGLTQEKVRRWQSQLRRAADTLEELL